MHIIILRYIMWQRGGSFCLVKSKILYVLVPLEILCYQILSIYYHHPLSSMTPPHSFYFLSLEYICMHLLVWSIRTLLSKWKTTEVAVAPDENKGPRHHVRRASCCGVDALKNVFLHPTSLLMSHTSLLVFIKCLVLAMSTRCSRLAYKPTHTHTIKSAWFLTC